jgi:hypothetical protein
MDSLASTLDGTNDGVELSLSSSPATGSGVVGTLDRGDEEPAFMNSSPVLTCSVVVRSIGVDDLWLHLMGDAARRCFAASRSISSGSSNQNAVAFGPCTPRMFVPDGVRR